MSVNGLASAATSHANAQLSNQVGIVVASKVQDAAKAQGQAIVELMQGAAEIASNGSNPSGKGQVIDVVG